MHNFAVNLTRTHVFSKVAYNQMTMKADGVAKTAIVTPFGQFEYLRMPFGLNNAAHRGDRGQSAYGARPPLGFYLDLYNDLFGNSGNNL